MYCTVFAFGNYDFINMAYGVQFILCTMSQKALLNHQYLF